MKKLHVSLLVGGLVIAGLLGGAVVTHATTPTVSLSATGNGDSVLVTGVGDVYSSVTLYYQKTGYGAQSQYLGATNASGYFSTTISTSAYGVVAGSYAYVMVNNQTSVSVLWPSGTTGGTVTLSQANVSVQVGQSVNLTVSGGSTPYTMYPSVANIFQSVISGNTLTIIGSNAGSGTLNVCSAGSAGCATLSVTVTSAPVVTPVSLGQSNLSLNVNSTANVTVSGNGGYYISNHTNSSVSSAYINGSTLTIGALYAGSDTITVCQNVGGSCATLYVTVNNNNTISATPISFSQSSPALTIGQSVAITIYGGQLYAGLACTTSSYYCNTPSYTIPYNSNSSSVTTSLNGSTITLSGWQNGTTVIVVCSSTSNCGAITVTVGATNSGTWTDCGKEGHTCYFSGTQTVRYGANGVYTYRTMTGSVLCSNATFGDPLFGVVKRCSIGGAVTY